MKENKKCGPGCNCVNCRNLYVTHHPDQDVDDIHELELEELVQEAQSLEDEFINDSDDDLMIEEDEELDEIMHFVFGEDFDSDCDTDSEH